jgi:hypothetical protein
LLSRVNAWADEVKHDLATPDLWAEIQREVKLLGVGSDHVKENTPFTPNEQKEIARRYVDWTVGGEQSLRGAGQVESCKPSAPQPPTIRPSDQVHAAPERVLGSGSN